MAKPDLSLAGEFDAALAWWRAAGVDCDFSDDVTVWLADAPLAAASPQSGASIAGTRTAPTSQASSQQSSAGEQPRKPPLAPLAPPAPTPLRRNLLGDSPPSDIAAFRIWWQQATGLDTARLYPRIAPRGPLGADLMVLVPQPEEHDRDQLLEGPQGRLLANIIAAIGLDETRIAIASALPCHTPMADLAALAAGGMDKVLAHHIALVQPKRLLVLGTGLAAMLGDAQSDKADQPLREINHSAGKVPVMVSETLDAMIDMPRLKARFWKRWIEWSVS